jgi:hypothetical protein
MIGKLRQAIRDYIFAFRFKRAVEKADKRALLTHVRHYIIVLGGQLRVVTMADIDNMIKMGIMARWVTRYDIRQRALYATPFAFTQKRREETPCS